MKKAIITIGILIIAISIFINIQHQKQNRETQETSVSQTTNTTTFQSKDETKKSQFCTEEKVKECEKNKNSQCCPFELN